MLGCYPLVFVKGAITGGAEMHAGPDEILFPFDPQAAVIRAGGNQHHAALVFPVAQPLKIGVNLPQLNIGQIVNRKVGKGCKETA